MKTLFSRLLSVVLTISLFAALLCVGVFADDPTEIKGELGAALNYDVASESTGFEYVSGKLPDGLKVTFSDGKVTLSGTPTASGDYNYDISVKTADGSTVYSLLVRIAEPAVPDPTPTPAPTPEPTPAPTPVPAPSITKDPTGESVIEGDSAIFIAHADNADEVTWRIESPDSSKSYDAKDIGRYFPGAYADGYDEDTLVLYNIRYEMDSWKAVCKFIGPGGSTFSKGAVITVDRSGLTRPVITKDPFVTPDSDTLSVTATDPNGGTLSYQWYSSSDNSNVNSDKTDIKIEGATSSTFVPPETPGTVYYYCEVTSRLNDQVSTPSYSRVAAVTHAIPETPAPTAEPTPIPAPTAVPADELPSASQIRDGAKMSSSKFLLILMGVLILALIAAAVSLVIISRREKQLDEEEFAQEEMARRARSVEQSRVSARAVKADAVGRAGQDAPAPSAKKAPERPVAPVKMVEPVLPPEEKKAEAAEAESVPAEPASPEAVQEDEVKHADLPGFEADMAAAGPIFEENAERPLPEDFVLDGWYCEKCGTFNRGRHCTACGDEKPADAVQYVCDSCGWTAPDPAHPPRFCPDCGAPYAAADKK